MIAGMTGAKQVQTKEWQPENAAPSTPTMPVQTASETAPSASASEPKDQAASSASAAQ